MANPIRLYKAWFKTQKSDNGKEVKITAYYATSPNNLPTAPGGTQNGIMTCTISCQKLLEEREETKEETTTKAYLNQKKSYSPLHLLHWSY
jgi:hypothetical protein